MDSLEQKLIVDLEPEYQLIYSRAKHFVKSSLPKEFKDVMPYSIHFLARRYVDCIKDVPIDIKPYIFSEYLFEGSENYNPNLAAMVCEYFGGIIPESLESRKSIFTLKDFEFRLSCVYNMLSKENPCFEGLSYLSSEILQGFRNTTSDIKGSNIVELDFSRN